MIETSLLVVATDQARVLEAQLRSLVEAGLDERVEVVVVDDSGGAPEVAALLARLEGDVVVLRPGAAVGRRVGLALAASAARGGVCIALASTTRVEAGFVDPLVAAVRGGAALAAPLVGDAAGYRADDDGSLRARRPGDEAPLDALSLDCLAAPRCFWRERLPCLAPVDGPYETHLAAAAGGPLAVAAEARVRREALGPAASVLVCTRDRAGEVAAAVESLLEHGATDVLVVDNGSSDATADVARELATRHGGAVRLVEEPVAGLSRARNTGAAHARNDVLLYLDDDARPAPGWLEALRDAFLDPRVVVAGGPIHALWLDGRLPEELAGYVSVFSRGDADVTADTVEVWGANYAVRASALAAAGGFDERWGAGAHGALGADETELSLRIRRLGLGLTRYVTAAAVGHRIGGDRVDERWLVVRVYRHGVEIPHVKAGFQAPPAGLLHAEARRAGLELAQALPLAGRLDVDAALGRVLAASAPLEMRLAAARSLGTVASCVAQLGETSCTIGPLVLEVRPEHAVGRVGLPHREAA